MSNRDKPGLLRVEGVVRHYPWGGYHFIPELLGIDNASKRPFAELWIGTHPSAPSSVRTAGGSVPLNRVVQQSPEAILGPQAAARFGPRLPYLFKILDARTMLSIQAHPTRAQAMVGFARENAAGIPLHAAHRNYKDDNHKPEVHVALTEFWMLHGFRPLEEIGQVLEKNPELRPAFPGFGSRGVGQALLRTSYEHVMTMPQAAVDAVLEPLLRRLARENPLDKNQPGYWALRAAGDYPMAEDHRDRGIFSVYLLNLVHLRPGQGTYQPAGVLHAYLEGANVELMADSDNVLRGGLTSKYVDVAELMNIVRFESGAPAVLEGEPVSGCETVFPTEAEEFELRRIQLGAGERCFRRTEDGPESAIVLEGSARIVANDSEWPLKRGEVVLIPWGTHYTIVAENQPAVLFLAGVPFTAPFPPGTADAGL